MRLLHRDDAATFFVCMEKILMREGKLLVVCPFLPDKAGYFRVMIFPD